MPDKPAQMRQYEINLFIKIFMQVFFNHPDDTALISARV